MTMRKDYYYYYYYCYYYYYYRCRQTGQGDISFTYGYIGRLYTTEGWLFATIDPSYLQDGLYVPQ